RLAVAVCVCPRPGLEVLWVRLLDLLLAELAPLVGRNRVADGEALPDQARADCLPVDLDLAAIRLAGEKHLRDAGREQRIGEAEQEREGHRGDDRGCQVAP